MMTEKLVRLANPHGGPCTVLGLFVRENGNPRRPTMVYRTRSTSEAHVPRRMVHVDPCRSCQDHPRSRFPHFLTEEPGR